MLPTPTYFQPNNTNMSAYTMPQIIANYEKKHGTASRPQLSQTKSDESWDSQSTAPTIAASETASIKATSSQSEKSTTRKVWDKIKKAAKEHHESVNGAYIAYYSPGTIKNVEFK